MKTTITEEREVCDICQKVECYKWNACLACGKLICRECLETHGVEYQHSISCSGSGDGRYCLPCDARLRAEGTDKRHRAYLSIYSLRNELRGFNEDFKKRSDAAEALLKTLIN